MAGLVATIPANIASVNRKHDLKALGRSTISFGFSYTDLVNTLSLPGISLDFAALYSLQANLFSSVVNFGVIKSINFSWFWNQKVIADFGLPLLLVQTLDTFQTTVISPDVDFLPTTGSITTGLSGTVTGAFNILTNSEQLNFAMTANADSNCSLIVNVNNFEVMPYMYAGTTYPVTSTP